MDLKKQQRQENEQALIENLAKRNAAVKIDGNININTLITAATLLISGALAYATLDKRITILEQMYMDRTARTEEQMRDLRREVKELTVTLNAIAQRPRKDNP